MFTVTLPLKATWIGMVTPALYDPAACVEDRLVTVVPELATTSVPAPVAEVLIAPEQGEVL